MICSMRSSRIGGQHGGLSGTRFGNRRFGGVIYGFIKTKIPGWGRYTTSLMLLILVLYVAAVISVLGKAEWPTLANLLFAVAGFAGGMLAPEKEMPVS